MPECSHRNRRWTVQSVANPEDRIREDLEVGHAFEIVSNDLGKYTSRTTWESAAGAKEPMRLAIGGQSPVAADRIGHGRDGMLPHGALLLKGSQD